MFLKLCKINYEYDILTAKHYKVLKLSFTVNLDIKSENYFFFNFQLFSNNNVNMNITKNNK